jgi:hypothetical protein
MSLQAPGCPKCRYAPPASGGHCPACGTPFRAPKAANANDIVDGREILVDEKQRLLEQTALRGIRTKLDFIKAEEQDIRQLNSGLWKIVIALLIIFFLLMLGFIFSRKDAGQPVENWPVLKQPQAQGNK